MNLMNGAEINNAFEVEVKEWTVRNYEKIIIKIVMRDRTEFDVGACDSNKTILLFI